MTESPTNASTASTATPKPTHTPGPWDTDTDDLGTWINAKGVAAPLARMGKCTDLPTKSNAGRIVACVNACEGLDPAEVGTLKQQRDELLGALEVLMPFVDESDPLHEVRHTIEEDEESAISRARSAIANATAKGEGDSP